MSVTQPVLKMNLKNITLCIAYHFNPYWVDLNLPLWSWWLVFNLGIMGFIVRNGMHR
jgi:hypothetical protein